MSKPFIVRATARAANLVEIRVVMGRLLVDEIRTRAKQAPCQPRSFAKLLFLKGIIFCVRTALAADSVRGRPDGHRRISRQNRSGYRATPPRPAGTHSRSMRKDAGRRPQPFRPDRS